MSESVRDAGNLHRYFSSVPHLVVDDDRLTREDRALYLYYKRVAGENGECFQPNKTVAERSGVGVTMLKESKARLVEYGYITVAEVPGNPTVVTINDVWDKNFESYKGGRVAATPPSQGDHPLAAGRPPGGRVAATPPSQGDHPTYQEKHTKKNTLRKTHEEEAPEAVVVVNGESMNVFKLYEHAFGFNLSPMQVEVLREMETEYPIECIAHAFESAVKANARNLRYVEAICRRHKAQGDCFKGQRVAEEGSARAQMLARMGALKGA